MRCLSASCLSLAQEGYLHSIVFYNVENLFDSYDNPLTFDDDYTPQGKNRWTEKKVALKIDHIAKVIHQLGQDLTHRPPLLIGLAEVENRTLLQQLIFHPLLRQYNYGIIHVESDDFRGIDVALLYQKDHFIPQNHATYLPKLNDPKTGYIRTSRDILVVSGYLRKHQLSILINHWPSRRGGKIKSAPHRFAVAQLHKQITDSIVRRHPRGKIISMGDYNDNPKDKSIQWIIGKKRKWVAPMEGLEKKGIGSLAHNDRWYLFDQLLFSPNGKTLPFDDYQCTSLSSPMVTYPTRTLSGISFSNPFRRKYLRRIFRSFPCLCAYWGNDQLA